MSKILEKVELWYEEFLIFQNSLTQSVWKRYHMFGGRENNHFKIGETVVSHNHHSSSPYLLQSTLLNSLCMFVYLYIFTVTDWNVTCVIVLLLLPLWSLFTHPCPLTHWIPNVWDSMWACNMCKVTTFSVLQFRRAEVFNI